MTATPKQPTRERGERTTLPISEALPPLLDNSGLSVTALAGLLEIKQSHLAGRFGVWTARSSMANSPSGSP